MTKVVSMINMKGGVGKTTLTFNIAWSLAWSKAKKILVVDLDPQANLSQYLLGADEYLRFLQTDKKSVLDIYEQYAPKSYSDDICHIDPGEVILRVRDWTDHDGSLIDLIPSKLELSWVLENPAGKSKLLSEFLDSVKSKYDLVIIDCAPTDSMLTTAAYFSSNFIFVPVKAEFLATIGLPLLAKSLKKFQHKNPQHDIEMGGIIFNNVQRSVTSPEQKKSLRDVERLANTFEWSVFDNYLHHSISFPSGSRTSDPIFRTKHARKPIKKEFKDLINEFIKAIDL